LLGANFAVGRIELNNKLVIRVDFNAVIVVVAGAQGQFKDTFSDLWSSSHAVVFLKFIVEAKIQTVGPPGLVITIDARRITLGAWGLQFNFFKRLYAL